LAFQQAKTCAPTIAVMTQLRRSAPAN
jgi:hypothetical protein